MCSLLCIRQILLAFAACPVKLCALFLCLSLASLINKYFCRGTEKTIKTQIMKNNEHKGRENSNKKRRGDSSSRRGRQSNKRGAAPDGSRLPHCVYTAKLSMECSCRTSRYFCDWEELADEHVGGDLFLDMPLGGGGGLVSEQERVFL